LPDIRKKPSVPRDEASSTEADTAPAAPGGDPAADLVQRAQNGDGTAAQELLLLYEDKLYGLSYRLALGDEQEARDLFQEACYRILSQLRKFKGNSLFSTWMYRVAVNAAVSSLRRSRRWSRLHLLSMGSEALEQMRGSSSDREAAEADPLHVFINRQLRRDLRKALQGLSFKQQLVFQLKVFEDLSLAEIAETAGMAEGTVKSHLARATKHIRYKLRKWTEQE
jgi:RNA polymerase sigma-70 factor (ECF subfamily)